MRILGIRQLRTGRQCSCSGRDGAVDDQVIAEYTVNYKKTHSQTLLRCWTEIVKMTELDPHTVDMIAVAGGPDHLRDFVSVPQRPRDLDFALEKPLIHIPTLEGLRLQSVRNPQMLYVRSWIRRGQVCGDL